MSYPFGSPGQQTTQPFTGFTYTQPQQQQSKGFSFASPPTTSGFSFGGTPTTIASTGGFSFGGAAAASVNSGFTFGGSGTAPASTGYSFGTPAPTSTNSGFSFGSPAVTSPNAGFTFGAPTTTSASSGFSFGAPVVTTTASSFSFGAPTPTTTTASSVYFGGTPSTAFGFVAPTVPASSGGFSFSSVPTTTTATVTPNTGSVGFPFGNNQISTTGNTGFSFGAPVTSAVPTTSVTGFSFGNPTTSTVTSTTTSSGNTGFTFPSSTPAFSSFTFGPPKTTAATATTGGFSFGAPTPAVGNTRFTMGTTTPVAPSAVNPPPPYNVGITTTQVTAIAPAPSSTSGGFAMVSNVVPSTIQSTGGNSAGFIVGQPAKAPAFNLATPPVVSAPNTGMNFSAPASTASSNIAAVKPTLNFATPATPVTQTASVAVVPPVTSQVDQAKVANSAFTTTTVATGTVPSSTSITPGFAFSAPTSLAPTAITTASTGFAAASLSPAPAFAGIKPTTSASGTPFMATTSTSFPSSGPSTFTFGTVTTTVPATSTSVPTTTPAVMATTTTVTQASAAPTTTMNFRQLEDTINKWKIELEEQERVFLNQATQVNAWDRQLIANGEKITVLNEAVDRVKLDQQRLDHELDFILAQQRELEELLIPLEKSVESTPSISVQQHADLEREHTYHLAENIDAQLKRMAEDIKEIIEHLNTANKAQDDNDPMQQIAKILNAHMDALQWIDQNTAALQRKMDDTSKLYETQRRDQEKSFRIGYN